jgi:hypothetical protein
MKSILAIIMICSAAIAWAESKEITPQIMLISSSLDKTLSANQSVYQFKFKGIYDNRIERYMDFSVDGKTFRKKLSDQFELSIMTTPGKHAFQFFYNEYHMEVYSDSLSIKPKYRNKYEVQLESAIVPIMAEKPVIYLYPTEETQIQVKLNVKGKSTYTYPTYNNGWEFTASPNGELQFGDKRYNYLFWEAENEVKITDDYLSRGFVVKGSDVTTFLEQRLTEAGLSSKEQADFITYWGPRMAQNEFNYVHFEFNKSCDQYAELDITPTPVEIYRLYMTWQKTEPGLKVIEQKMEKIQRKGFTVVEWGGLEIKPNMIQRKHAL